MVRLMNSQKRPDQMERSRRGREARASRAPCLASRQTHLRPIRNAKGDTLRINLSKTDCGKERGSAARDAPRLDRDGRAPQSFQCCGQSKPVKVNQSDSVGQAGGQNPCKSIKINNLQNKQLQSGQTVYILVNMVKNSQSSSGSGRSGVARSFAACFSLLERFGNQSLLTAAFRK